MRVRTFLVLIVSLALVAMSGQAVFARRVQITWLSDTNPKYINMDQLISIFEKENPEIKVNYQWTPARYEEKLRILLAAGLPPDVIRLNDDYVVSYGARGALFPLDELMKEGGIYEKREGWYETFWDWPIVAKHHIAWMYGYTIRCLYVNVDLFEEAGVPLPPKKWETPEWNWDEFIKVAKKLTRDLNDDGMIDQWGTCAYHDTGCEETFSRNNGGPGIYSEDGRKFTLANPLGYEAMQWLADLAYVHKVHPPRALFMTLSPDDMFVQGKLAMEYACAPRLTSRFRRDIGNRFRYVLRPLPMKVKGINEGSLETHAIPIHAKHPHEAFKWLYFLTTETAQRLIGEGGFSILLNRDWVLKYNIEPELQPGDPEVLITGMEVYVPVHKAVNVDRARHIYRPMLQKVWDGEATAKEILQGVQPEIEELLAEFPHIEF